MASNSQPKFAIRFGLSAIKAIGSNITNHIVEKELPRAILPIFMILPKESIPNLLIKNQ